MNTTKRRRFGIALLLALLLALFNITTTIKADPIDPMPDCYPCTDPPPTDPTISPDLSCPGCGDAAYTIYIR